MVDMFEQVEVFEDEKESGPGLGWTSPEISSRRKTNVFMHAKMPINPFVNKIFSIFFRPQTVRLFGYSMILSGEHFTDKFKLSVHEELVISFC